MEVLLDAKSQTAMYCQGGGAVAEVIGVRCNGWTHVKGDGVLSKGDKYGESYRRLCPMTGSCNGVIRGTTS